MKQITTIGLDLAKQVFQIHGADAEGSPIFVRKVERASGATALQGRGRRTRQQDGAGHLDALNQGRDISAGSGVGEWRSELLNRKSAKTN